MENVLFLVAAAVLGFIFIVLYRLKVASMRHELEEKYSSKTEKQTLYYQGRERVLVQSLTRLLPAVSAENFQKEHDEVTTKMVIHHNEQELSELKKGEIAGCNIILKAMHDYESRRNQL